MVSIVDSLVGAICHPVQMRRMTSRLKLNCPWKQTALMALQLSIKVLAHSVNVNALQAAKITSRENRQKQQAACHVFMAFNLFITVDILLKCSLPEATIKTLETSQHENWIVRLFFDLRTPIPGTR